MQGKQCIHHGKTEISGFPVKSRKKRRCWLLGTTPWDPRSLRERYTIVVISRRGTACALFLRCISIDIALFSARKLFEEPIEHTIMLWRTWPKLQTSSTYITAIGTSRTPRKVTGGDVFGSQNPAHFFVKCGSDRSSTKAQSIARATVSPPAATSV